MMTRTRAIKTAETLEAAARILIKTGFDKNIPVKDALSMIDEMRKVSRILSHIPACHTLTLDDLMDVFTTANTIHHMDNEFEDDSIRGESFDND